MFADKTLAIEVLELFNKIDDQMNESIIAVKDICQEQEYIEYKRSVGAVMAESFIEIKFKIYEKYPDLKPYNL